MFWKKKNPSTLRLRKASPGLSLEPSQKASRLSIELGLGVITPLTVSGPLSQVATCNNIYHCKLQPAVAFLRAWHRTHEATAAPQLPGSQDDNLSPGWRDPHFNSRVPIFSELPSQKLIQLCFEDTVSHKLKNKWTKSSSVQVLSLNTRFMHPEFGGGSCLGLSCRLEPLPTRRGSSSGEK